LAATSTEDHHFAILAIDHIGSMAQTMRPDDPSAVTNAQITQAKLEIARRLRHLVSAVLLDPFVIESTQPERTSLAGGTGLVVGVEDGDYVSMGSTPRLVDGWSVERAVENGADAIKIAFYFDPDESAAEVERFVKEVADECSRLGVPLFAEPLGVFRDAPGRCEVIVEAARRFSSLGVDVLKLEFPEDVSVVTEEGAWFESCAAVAAASEVPWTLLSGGEDFERFSQMLRVACTSGASGFVVGRTIWRDAVQGGTIDSAWVPDAAARLDELVRVTRDSARSWSQGLAHDGVVDR
jgi:tagatose 1,6-diphosphate aldolase